MSRRPSMAWALALAGGFLAAACTKGDPPPGGSVEYYRSHAAEWERAVWVCTNDGSAYLHTIGCANALRLLDESRVAAARQQCVVGSVDSRASMAQE